MGPEAYEDFRRTTRDPNAVQTMVENYRAANRRIRCPTLFLR
jgi:hypothetical protein